MNILVSDNPSLLRRRCYTKAQNKETQQQQQQQQQQQLDQMKIIEYRHARQSIIIVSQFPVASWYDVMDKLSRNLGTVAILDRYAHTTDPIELRDWNEITYPF